MIAQMQGKFQLVVVGGVGHVVHEVRVCVFVFVSFAGVRVRRCFIG
jgi:hypothetical protein